MDLLEALQLSREISAVKCAAHKSGCDFVTTGNSFVEEMARYCALDSCIFYQDEQCKLDNGPVSNKFLNTVNSYE